ncbi:helix-turn-helix domain-containing protein [Nocardia sp. alder85J]|uniref:helix-turn-helix domain-containing protein n=1 Tax=Nocardia sp. alder85J TaxID=2862949 RepID=UPI001CD347E7|nr:helix-turn-helix transcriptional regulator [Nocardia sp. alder85J]MCX4097681.1 helix-turn-helix transcriptional regulator [Nocardia sp. alder85J]
MDAHGDDDDTTERGLATYTPPAAAEEVGNGPIRPTDEHLEFCGGVLRARRDELDLTRRDARSVGLSPSMVNDYENGYRAPKRPETFDKLDTWLRCLSGSVWNLYHHGRDLVPIEVPAPLPQTRVPAKLYPVEMPLQALIDLAGADAALARIALTTRNSELREVHEVIARSTDMLLRAFYDGQVAGRRADGVPDDPFVTAMLATTLARKTPNNNESRAELALLRAHLSADGEPSADPPSG